MPPVIVKVSASVAIEDPVAKVMAPAYELLPEMLRKAPPLLMPVPFKDKASAPTAMPPVNSKAAPLTTVIVPAVVPAPVALLSRTAPLLIVVAPVKSFAPESVSVDAPILMSVPEPLNTLP